MSLSSQGKKKKKTEEEKKVSDKLLLEISEKHGSLNQFCIVLTKTLLYTWASIPPIIF